MAHIVNMNVPHLKNLIHANILERQNHYTEYHFGIPDQFIIDVTEYLFNGAYTLDAVDVVTPATTHAIMLLVNIAQYVNGKAAVIPHIPVISGSYRGSVTLLHMLRIKVRSCGLCIT